MDHGFAGWIGLIGFFGRGIVLEKGVLLEVREEGEVVQSGANGCKRVLRVVGVCSL
jgi:hypothetical protein